MERKEKRLLRTKTYQGLLVDVFLDKVELSQNQAKVQRELVVKGAGACVLCKCPNQSLVMVKQFRYGSQKDSLEFVAGMCEDQEDPLVSAQRELLEETGFIGKNWMYLGPTYPSPAYLDEVIHLYFCEADAVGQQNLDDNEFLDVILMTKKDIDQAIRQGEIYDLKTIALFYQAIAHHLI